MAKERHIKLGPGVRINWPKLREEMERKRKAAGLSIIAVSLECGFTSGSAWFAVVNGGQCHAEKFVRILCWLGTADMRPYLLWDAKGDKGW